MQGLDKLLFSNILGAFFLSCLFYTPLLSAKHFIQFPSTQTSYFPISKLKTSILEENAIHYSRTIASTKSPLEYSNLTEVQKQAVRDAIGAGLMLDLLNVKIHSNKMQTIIVLGEQHWDKKREVFAAESELISFFSIRAVELYRGAGREHTLAEKKTLGIVDQVEIKSKAESKAKRSKTHVNDSAIRVAVSKGLFFDPIGHVYLNGEPIRYLDQQDYFEAKESYVDVEANIFFEANINLTSQVDSVVKRVAQIRNTIGMPELWHAYQSKNEEHELDVTSPPDSYTTIGIEFGSLSKWSHIQTCQNTFFCVGKEAQADLVSKRDLRFYDNLFLTLALAKEINTILVVVGQLHVPALRKLFHEYLVHSN